MVEQQMHQLNNDFQIYGNFIDDVDENNELSFHHRVPSILNDLDWNDMTTIIHRMDKEPGLSFHLRRQAKYDKKMTLSLREKLIKENLIARAPYKGDQFYIGSKVEFEERATAYINQTGLYNLIDIINPTVSQTCLKTVLKQVEITLNNLHASKSITDWQYVLMHPRRSIIRLNYLYFVPDLHEVCFLFDSYPLSFFASGIHAQIFSRKKKHFIRLSYVKMDPPGISSII